MGRKKILIGSILAVALLTLVSFSNVVGYLSVNSEPKTNSPLFSIRNNKRDVSSNYIGKEDSINILIPKRNVDSELINKFIDNLKEMDDNSFDEFINELINFIHHNDNLKNVKLSDKEGFIPK